MKKYRKPYKIKRRKSVLRSRFFWSGIVVLAVIGAVSYFLFFFEVFQIKKIAVSGGEKISEENIKAFIPQKSIFLVDLEEIERDILNSFPIIGKVEIYRRFPDALDVLVIERIASALWCEKESCFLMDEEGMIFEEATLLETDLIRITGAKESLDKEKITQIMGIREKLKNSLGVTTTQAFIAPEERVNIKISEGWEIYFNAAGDLDWQMQELSLVLDKQISPEKRRNLEYIDLRFSRVYYK